MILLVTRVLFSILLGGLAVASVAFGAATFDVSYLWHSNVDGVLDYRKRVV